jgi:hypothetical protein
MGADAVLRRTKSQNELTPYRDGEVPLDRGVRAQSRAACHGTVQIRSKRRRREEHDEERRAGDRPESPFRAECDLRDHAYTVGAGSS